MFLRTGLFLLAAVSAQAGILVLATPSGLQFVEAANIAVGGHDKVLMLGGAPKLPGPINKLPSGKVSGTILKDGDAKALAMYAQGAPQFFIPDGLPKTAPNNVAGIWGMGRISYKKAANDKTPTDVPVAQFLAFLPGGPEELAHLCTDTKALEFLSGKGKEFPMQLQFTAGAVKAYGSDPAMVTLQHSVAEAMSTRLDQFESGSAGVEVLEQGLEFAKLSQAAYPDVADQKQLRDSLAERRKWLDRKKAILRSFTAAGEWDAFLLADHDIERYRAAFRDMAPMHIEALNQSLATHKKAGEDLYKEQEYGASWREFRLASLRKPSDTVLQQSVRMAWGDYSGQVAKDHQGQGKALTSGERSAITQDLQRAKLSLEANKPDRALVEVTDAEHIDAFNLDVLLRKAEVLGKLRQYRQALMALDEYDKRAVDEQRNRAVELRANLEFQRDNSLDDIKGELKKAFAALNFHQAQELEKQGLESSPNDHDLLIYAARIGLVLRDTRGAREALRQYLDASTNLDTKEDERETVRQLLARVRDVPAETGGTANWLSGRKLPPSLFYDPSSGAFQQKIEHIAASNKLALNFEWDGDRLRSITPVFEKDVHVTGEQKVYFGYDGPNSPVTWAGMAADPRGAAPKDPDELFRRAVVRFANNPYQDPLAIQQLTGQNLTVGVAGNRFFDPFVWDKVHFFQLTYDDHGVLKQAREIADPKSAPGDQWLDFEWDGTRLTAVRGYQGSDAAHRTKIYERTMQYQDNRLVSEEVQYQGKSSKVHYNYTGGRLASASSDRDPSLDDRSRQVTFR